MFHEYVVLKNHTYYGENGKSRTEYKQWFKTFKAMIVMQTTRGWEN